MQALKFGTVRTVISRVIPVLSLPYNAREVWMCLFWLYSFYGCPFSTCTRSKYTSVLSMLTLDLDVMLGLEVQ